MNYLDEVLEGTPVLDDISDIDRVCKDAHQYIHDKGPSLHHSLTPKIVIDKFLEEYPNESLTYYKGALYEAMYQYLVQRDDMEQHIGLVPYIDGGGYGELGDRPFKYSRIKSPAIANLWYGRVAFISTLVCYLYKHGPSSVRDCCLDYNDLGYDDVLSLTLKACRNNGIIIITHERIEPTSIIHLNKYFLIDENPAFIKLGRGYYG